MKQASLFSSRVGGWGQVLRPEAGAGPAADPRPVGGDQGKTGLFGAPGTGWTDHSGIYMVHT